MPLKKHPVIFKDPVYGFVSVPSGTIFKLVEHPFFQRLRRIYQLGLTHLVFPGAVHTRFQHALGALHLMGQAISVLRLKGHEVSPDEEAGEIPKAFVVLKEELSPEDIMQFIAERVAPHKKIRRVETVDQIPKSISGKILRRVLVQREREKYG